MRRRLLAGALAAGWCIPAGLAVAADISANLTLAPEWRGADAGSAYAVPDTFGVVQERSLRQDLAVRFAEGGLNAEGRLRVEAGDGQTPERLGIVNHLYYEGNVGHGHGYLLGKKVMSWGVGFGLRPLDVVQREDRRSLNPPPLTGVPLAAWEYYSADHAMTLAWTNPTHGRAADDFRDRALALRYYHLRGDVDLHAVARLSRRHALEAGAGVAQTAGEAWANHAALLYQRRFSRTLNGLAESPGAALATSDPFLEVRERHGIKAVAGTQWTGSAGVSVLAEAWYDAEAYSRDQWRRLNALTASQRALSGLAPSAAIDGNIAWSSRAFDRPNLLRENLLLRVAYDAESWKPALELLFTPRDRGRVLTASLSHEGNRQRVSLGVRQLGGAADSAYAQAPVKAMAYGEWRLALF